LAIVALVKGERGLQPVYKALDLVNYKTALREHSTALIKVNFITTKTWDTGATTDPIVVEAIINKLHEASVEAIVVESDATTTNADKAYAATGIKDLCERTSTKWLNLRHLQDRVELPIPDGLALRSITVPRIVTESAIVTAAKLKTHNETVVTLGMKNMFGLLPDKFKGKYHIKGISKVIVDINTVLKSTLTVIDGFTAMEGLGPVHGRPVQMNTVIAGTDPVATDATAARVMGFNPQTISHIRKAHEKGLGQIDDIHVLGETLDATKRRFSRT